MGEGALSRLVYGVAAIAGVRALVFWIVARAALDPDTSLYARGGLGLFPSPLGRLVGNGGEWGIALFNVAANVLLVLGAAQLARRHGGRPLLAASIALAAPLALWTIFAAMDTAAAAAIVWALALGRRSLLAVAVGLHLAALLVAVALVAREARVRVVAGLAAVGLVLLLATPYRSVLSIDMGLVASSAAITVGVFALTFAPFVRRIAPALPIVLGGAVAAGLVAGAAWQTNMRYTLPAVPVAAAYSTVRRVPA